MAELIERDAATWSQFVTDFDGTYNSFMANWNALFDLAPFVADHPNLQAEYDYWVNRAGKSAQTLQNLKATRDTAARWLNSIVGGVSETVEWIGKQTGLYGYNSLGIAPLIYVALGAGAALAAIQAIGADNLGLSQFAQRSNMTVEFMRQTNPATGKPYTIDEAATAVNKLAPSSLLGDISGIVTMLVIGAAVIFLGPPLLKAIGGK
ncbi:MAG: hypothetical protein ACREUY_01150 [Burkholderiales bacterium]